MAIIDWNGQPESTHVVWVNAKTISTIEGVRSLEVDHGVQGGASGGGVFYIGTHVANTWGSNPAETASYAPFNPNPLP